MPKVVDKKKKSEDIALAALALFAQRGFSSTSVEQIAEAVEIGKSTIYEYFKTKDDIFVAAITLWIDHAGNQISEMITEIDDPVERLYAFVRRNMKLFDPENYQDPHDNRLYIEMLQQTFMEGGAFVHRPYLLKEMGNKIRSILVDILLDGISKRLFKPEIARDAERYAINIVAYINGIVQHIMMDPDPEEYRIQAELFIENFLRSIRLDKEE